MAVTITRTAMTDDDGSLTTGTIFNNAWKTALYDQIDTALALLLPLAGGTMTGNLTISSTAPRLQLTDTTASAKSLRLDVDADKAHFYEAAGSVGQILSMDLANNRVGVGTASPAWPFQINPTFTTTGSLVLGANDFTSLYIGGTHAATTGMGISALFLTSISSGTQSDLAQLAVFNATGAGVVTRQAGILVRSLTKGTNNTYLLLGTDTIPGADYGIYLNTTNQNYFAGRVGIGATVPLSKLHIEGASGWIVQDEQDTNPTSTELDANDAVAVYNKANKFVIAYNNAGTITYVSIPLDGSTTAWTHSTSAP